MSIQTANTGLITVDILQLASTSGVYQFATTLQREQYNAWLNEILDVPTTLCVSSEWRVQKRKVFTSMIGRAHVSRLTADEQIQLANATRGNTISWENLPLIRKVSERAGSLQDTPVIPPEQKDFPL